MKIQESFLTNQGTNNNHEWAEYKIIIDGVEVFEVKHNSNTPEENTLFNNFKDCYNILPLLKTFYEYGKIGKELEFSIK